MALPLNMVKISRGKRRCERELDFRHHYFQLLLLRIFDVLFRQRLAKRVWSTKAALVFVHEKLLVSHDGSAFVSITTIITIFRAK